MNRLLQQLNLRRYLPFFESCHEKHYALAIYNNFGTQQLLEESLEKSDKINNALFCINNNCDWDNLNIENNHQPLGDQSYLQLVPLILGASEKLYWLAGINCSEACIPQEQHLLKSRKLSQIAECLKEDYTLVETLNGMADELAVRYEELNLLYGIDDSDSYYKNNDESESLSQLLSNCIDYLNLDLTILYLPELEICLHRSNSKITEKYELLIKTIYHQVYPYMTNHQETLVINRDQDSDWTDVGLIIPYKLIISPVIKSNQQINGILVLINNLNKPDFSNSDRKLTEILAAEASKLTQARRDNITGQLNRRGLTEKLEKIIAFHKTNPQQQCLLLINIDQFRVINDTGGQAAGDLLLKQVNSLIQKNLKKADVLGRLGADEFVVILDNCTLGDAKIIADRIRVVIKQFRYFYQEKLFDISACVGVVDLNEEIKDYCDALRAADLACSVAKEQGRNRIHVYEKDDENLVTHENQMKWVSRINIGIEENRFQVYRQKIQPLQTQEDALEHYEILLRLKNNNGEIISPIHFIPAAERYSLMPELDRWVVKTTLEKMAFINKTQPQNSFSCSINLSGQSFCEERFSAFLIEQIDKSGVSPSNLCFEITETAAVSNMTQAIEFIEKLKEIGCLFSLDDFGSGMSSFTYLKTLPVDYLKIDGYFVKTMLDNEIDKAMVASIHQIGSVMGIKTIAEFVETSAIFEELKKMGIDYGQGYSIGKPEPF